MSYDHKEQLYVNLFNVLQELTEYDSPEVIFDRIVDDFAYSAEYHSDQADVFTEMLNTFRHNNPMETIPDTVEETVVDETDRPVNWEAIEANLSPAKLDLMSGGKDDFLDFIQSMHFPTK